MAPSVGKVQLAEALGALWVGVTAMIAITIAAAASGLDPATGLGTKFHFLPWILFMCFPAGFVMGLQWKQVIPAIINIVAGYFIGGLLSGVMTGAFAGTGMYLGLAIGLAACICTFLLQYLFQGPLGATGLGKGALCYTPIAFCGMIIFFGSQWATGGAFSGAVLVYTIIAPALAAFVVWGCILMAKCCGLIPPKED